MLIDSHCHLDFPEFAEDMTATMDSARAAGVGRMITISTSMAKYDTYRGIAEDHDTVWFSTGTHPHRAHEEPDVSVDDILRKAEHPKCIAIGEAGLDYHYDKAPRDVAATVFRKHIAAARQSRLPLVIHSRDADADMAAILGLPGPAPLFHVFAGPGRNRAGTGSVCFLLWRIDVQELARAARYRPGRANGSASGGDRRAVSGSDTLSRQTQSASLCR
jgi:TatD family hydrolase